MSSDDTLTGRARGGARTRPYRPRIRAGIAAALASTALLGTMPAAATVAEESRRPSPVVETGGLGSLAGLYLAARHAGNVKDLAAAAAFYRTALERDPENILLLDRTVLLLVASGSVDEAAELAARLVEADPENKVALMALAVDHFADGDLARAKAAIGTFDTGGPLQELSAALLAAWVTAAEGEPMAAVEALDQISGPSWYSAFTNLHAGLISDYAGFSDIAVARLSETHAADPTALRVVDAYARALARNGERNRAASLLRTFGEEQGDDTYTVDLMTEILSGAPIAPQITEPTAGASEALFGLGTAVGREGGEMFAAGYLQLARHLHPDNHFASTTLAALFESMEQYQAAIDVYSTIPEWSLLHRKATIQRGLNLNALDRKDEAVAALTPLVEADPGDLEAVIALGNVLRSRQKFVEAAEIYSKGIEAVDVPDAYWSIYYYRGICYEQSDRWPLAEADFKRALEMEPDQPLVLNYLGYSWIDRGENLEEALDMVEKAVAQRPEDGYIVDSLGWAYYRLGEYDKAVETLERAVSLRANDPVINDHLGDAYWMVGRRLEAMFQWSHARDLDPEPDELAKILHKLEHGLQDPSGPALGTERAGIAAEDPAAGSTE